MNVVKRTSAKLGVILFGLALAATNATAAVVTVVPATLAADEAVIQGDMVAVGAVLISLALVALSIKYVKGTIFS